MPRIHLFGVSGSGTTSVGKALAEFFDCLQLDSDDYLWEPPIPPYDRLVAAPIRTENLKKDIDVEGSWILSGSVCGWGDFTIPMFVLAVFLWVPMEIRIERLKKRETRESGEQIWESTHPWHKGFIEFLDWAVKYDDAGPEMRSVQEHEPWIKTRSCPY